MKLLLVLGLFGVGSLAHADLAVHTSEDKTFVVYLANDRVYYEMCNGNPKPAARGCSGQPATALYSLEGDRYARSVQSFYGLIDRQYGGLQGPAALDKKIEHVKQHIDKSDLTVNELKDSEAVLRDLVGKKDKIERADREILQYLVAKEPGAFDEQLQSLRVQVINLAFYRVAYVASQKKLYRLTEPVGFQAQGGACQAFSKEWSPLNQHGSVASALNTELSASALIGQGERASVWLQGATGGSYRVSCGCSGGDGRPSRPVVRNYSPSELERTRQNASANKGMSLCRYTTGCAYVGAETVEWLPGNGSILQLGGAEPTTQSIPVEVGAGTFAGAYPVLCSRDFNYDLGNGEDGFLNGANFASFNLPELEVSFERMAKSVYANRADFLRKVASVLAAVPLKDSDDLKVAYRATSARIFALNAMEPVLVDIQSRFVEKYVLPDYQRAKERWNRKLGVASLVDIDLSAEVYRVALSLVRAALDASKPYLTGDELKSAEDLMPVLGRGLATGPAAIGDMADALQKQKKLLTALVEGRRTHGFGVMTLAVGDYLEKKRGK